MNLFFYWTVFVGSVFFPCSHGQGLVKETTDGSTAWQPWLVGLTAVTVFLVVMFAANLVNRIFFSQKKDDKYEMENMETKYSANVYENKAMDPEEESWDTRL